MCLYMSPGVVAWLMDSIQSRAMVIGAGFAPGETAAGN